MKHGSARVAILVIVGWGAWAGSAGAQAPSGSAASSAAASETRPATTTFLGDTGIWFVPTAEVVPAGKWSGSGYRRGTNYIQGYTNVADFAGTFAYGVKDRAEIFGSFLVDTRIDRDLRPLFGTEQSFGGVIDRYPLVNTTWTGDNVGDLYLGVKFKLLAAALRKRPAEFAVRATLKLPTGKKDAGVSTGNVDGIFDFIVSKDIASTVELSSYLGYEFRGVADGFEAPNGAFRWGAGASFRTHTPLSLFGELNGIVPSASTTTITGSPLFGIDGSRAPTISDTQSLTRATGGINFQARNGFFAGVGLSWNVPREARLTGRREADDDPFADYVDWQFRIGFHPGTHVYVPPPPPPPAPPPPPPPPPAPVAPPSHDLAVKADCNPCTVQVGQSSTVTATVTDSISCAVTYRWGAPSGTLDNPAVRQTQWTAPQQEGAVPVTVTVTCPSDNKTATDTVRIQVNRPAPVVELTFEDVYFDFDRYSLRPEALRLLDDAVAKLNANPGRNIIVEGHTCNIGTAEYNLALGERRAAAVRDYLASRGVAAGRLETRSYGEERPKYDNAREETRRLNRRAALVVKVQ